MRSVVRADAQVGLLLFDEPSASLDPIAEHGKRPLQVELCGHHTDVAYVAYLQICSTDYDNSEAARRWCSPHTGLAS